jgi:hypothetical protein
MSLTKNAFSSKSYREFRILEETDRRATNIKTGFMHVFGVPWLIITGSELDDWIY